MKEDLISIITPVYNCENYIAYTIESVLKQTFKNWELIIVDDYSQDNTCTIVSSYMKEDSRIKLIRNSSNLGVSTARNIALKNASGRYIAFLDGDDLWSPEKLEVQLSFMKEKKCVISFTDYMCFYDECNNKGNIIHCPSQITGKEILGNTIIGCLTVMVDKNISKEFYMPKIEHMEDQCTWMNILKEQYIGYGISKVLSFYRIRKRSLTRNKIYACKKQWHVYRHYFGFSILDSFKYFARYSFNAIKKYIL